MSLHTIRQGALRAVVSTRGGALLRLLIDRDGQETPLLRDGAESEQTGPLEAGCFPLVPFGNRIRGNRFEFEGRHHELAPNVEWDRHYLHGDGWLGEWRLLEQTPQSVLLGFEHARTNGPYAYTASQRFTLDATGLEIVLGVTNQGETALPFGLGWHPYFPLDPATTLTAPAAGWWTEGEHWLPDGYGPLPAELDFSTARTLPRHWLNNGFDGWNGRAEIDWPARGLGLSLESTCGCYFVFVSDRTFDPTYREDFFCFEPMSHPADAHNLPERPGLVRLAPGESMSASMRLRPRAKTAQALRAI